MSDIAQLQDLVEGAFEERDSIGASTRGEVREAVDAALDLLDAGDRAGGRETRRRPGSSTNG